MSGALVQGWNDLVARSAGWWAAASPTPKPKVPNADLVTPGVWGFVITFLVAVVTVLLIIDMTRRVRRTRYRAEIAEKLDAEEAAAAAREEPPA